MMRASPTATVTSVGSCSAGGCSPSRTTRAIATRNSRFGVGPGDLRAGSSRLRLASSLFHQRRDACAIPCPCANARAEPPLASHCATYSAHRTALIRMCPSLDRRGPARNPPPQAGDTAGDVRNDSHAAAFAAQFPAVAVAAWTLYVSFNAWLRRAAASSSSARPMTAGTSTASTADPLSGPRSGGARAAGTGAASRAAGRLRRA